MPDFLIAGFSDSFFDFLGYVFDSVAVVDDGVAFGSIDDCFDEVGSFACDGDDGMNIALVSQFDCEGSDCGAGAVDDEGDGRCCWCPGVGEVEMVV